MSTAKVLRAVFAEIIMVLSAAAGAAAQRPAPAEHTEITPGVVHPAIVCTRQPGNSYALYPPARYTTQEKWPIIYAFDPGARGEVPVRLYKDVAEKYGYILAGSNNAQNFDAQAQAEGTRAMLDDTLQRFSVDMERIYTTGFSGGARLATSIALRCARKCKIAGVIARGATYPATVSPSASDEVLYFIGLGDTDFNYPEIVQVRRDKETVGFSVSAADF